MATRLSGAAQLRYMLQWFEEWSELQRQDFLPLLAEKLARPAICLNGVVSSMAAVNCHNKPMSLFQCRIKLFNEWYPTWTEEERDRLVKGVSDVDREFGAKLQEQLAAEREPPAANGVTGPTEGHPAADAGESAGPADSEANGGEVGEAADDEGQPGRLASDGVECDADDIAPDNLQGSALPLEIAAS